MEQKAYVKENAIRVRGLLTLDETQVIFTPNKDPENNIIIPYSQIESVNKRGFVRSVFFWAFMPIKILGIIFIIVSAFSTQTNISYYFGNASRLNFKIKDGQKILIYTVRSSRKAKKFIKEKIASK